MRRTKVLAEWIKMGVGVVAVGLSAAACSSSSASLGAEVSVEERAGESVASPASKVASSGWDGFWSDFSAAVAAQDSLATADLTSFPYPSGSGESLESVTFVEQYDNLFPNEVREAFAEPGENLSLEVDGAEILIGSELQRLPEDGRFPGIDVDVDTARVFLVSEFSSVEGIETDFYYVFDLVDGEYRFIADYVF